MSIDLHGISQAAFDLIVTEEDSDQAYYTRHYEHFDWPEGASGPTIGIGYDCGYVTEAELRADWTGIVSDDTIAALLPAVGRRGQAAAEFVRAHAASVTITWDQSIAEFADREVPKWLARLAAAVPNTDKLPPDCRGALLSLAYNRGTGGFGDPGGRYSEMHAIKEDMASMKFEAIPGEFLSMRRLWPAGGDLWRRRGHEATLFQNGLGKPATPPADSSQVAPDEQGTKWVQTSLNRLGAKLTVDGIAGRGTAAAIAAFQAKHHLAADGIAGPQTMAAIRATLAAQEPAP